MKKRYDIAIVGGGPAGIISAIRLAEKNINLNKGVRIALVEKNKSLGNKLSITGGGRCNITNFKSMDHFLINTVRNSKFMYSAFRSFTNEDTIKFVNSIGVGTIVEDDNEQKVYLEPNSTHRFIDLLEKRILELGVDIIYGEEVVDLGELDSETKLITTTNLLIECKSLIVSTGGCSFPKTGSDGKMLKILKNHGYSITEIRPALSPIVLQDDWPRKIAGTSVKNIKINIFDKSKKKKKLKKSIYGDLVFTHKGIGGPATLKASSYINRDLGKYKLRIDFVPDMSYEDILLFIKSRRKKNINNIMSELLPSRLSDTLTKKSFERLGIDNIDIANAKKNDILCVLEYFKNIEVLPMSIMPIEVATVTSGGIDVKQINSSSMESKLHKNVYFCGEILDVDALSGGYNIQIALSTGYLAAESIYL